MLPFVIDPLSVVMVFALWPVVGGGLDPMPTTSENPPEHADSEQVATDRTYQLQFPAYTDANAVQCSSLAYDGPLSCSFSSQDGMGCSFPNLADAPKLLIEYVQSVELAEIMSEFRQLLWGEKAFMTEWETTWNQESLRESTSVEIFKVHDHVGPLFSENDSEEDYTQDFCGSSWRARSRPRFLDKYDKALVELVRSTGGPVDAIQEQTQSWLGMSFEKWLEWPKQKTIASTDSPIPTHSNWVFIF